MSDTIHNCFVSEVHGAGSKSPSLNSLTASYYGASDFDSNPAFRPPPRSRESCDHVIYRIDHQNDISGLATNSSSQDTSHLSNPRSNEPLNPIATRSMNFSLPDSFQESCPVPPPFSPLRGYGTDSKTGNRTINEIRRHSHGTTTEPTALQQNQPPMFHQENLNETAANTTTTSETQDEALTFNFTVGRPISQPVSTSISSSSSSLYSASSTNPAPGPTSDSPEQRTNHSMYQSLSGAPSSGPLPELNFHNANHKGMHNSSYSNSYNSPASSPALNNSGYHSGNSQNMQPSPHGIRSKSFQHTKSHSGSSFDFGIETTVTLPVHRQAQSQHAAVNKREPLHNDNSQDSFQINRTSGKPLVIAATPAQGQSFTHHRRHSSNASISYMTAIPQGVSMTHSSKVSIPSQQHSRKVSIGSNYTTYSHRRIDSISSHMSRASHTSHVSQTSRSSSETHHYSNVSGCSYVQELRRQAAATWCDIPPSVWGVPIGIADAALLPSRNPISGDGGTKKRLSLSRGQSSNSQRRLMDIRHSHLAPRLLASEIDDDDDLNSPTSVALSNNSNTTEEGDGGIGSFPRRESALGLSILTKAVGAGSTLAPSSGTTPSSASVSPESQSPVKSERVDLFRSGSLSSMKSVEEGTRKIKLFVANPDV